MPEKLSKNAINAWARVVRYVTHTTSAIDRDLEKHGAISLSQYDVLYSAYMCPSHRTRIGDIGRSTILSKSGLTRAVDGLVKAGYFKKQACPEDGRVQYVQVSAKGIAAMRKCWSIYQEHLAERFSGRFTPAQISILLELFKSESVL